MKTKVQTNSSDSLDLRKKETDDSQSQSKKITSSISLYLSGSYFIFQDFGINQFEDRLKEEIQYRDGKVRFASETETSEYDTDVTENALSPDMAPQITQRLKDFHLIEGADATFVSRILGKPRPKVLYCYL